MPTHDRIPTKQHRRLPKRAPQKVSEIQEHLSLISRTSAECGDQGRAVRTPTRSASALQIVSFPRRDVTKQHSLEAADIDAELKRIGQSLGADVEYFQTNFEGAMAEPIHQAYFDNLDAVLVIAGAWSHYSYGIRDALAILKCPILEVHMSNVHAREAFRHTSVFAEVVQGQICGFGTESYMAALRTAVTLVNKAAA